MESECPRTMFYGTLLLFLAGAASQVNLAASFITLIIISTLMHVITLKHDKKRRGFEHFTAWFLGAMAGVLVLGSLVLPHFEIYPTTSFIKMIRRREFVWDVSMQAAAMIIPIRF